MIAAGEVVGLDAKLEIWSHDWPQKKRLANGEDRLFCASLDFVRNLCNGLDYYLTASTHETQFRGLTLQ